MSSSSTARGATLSLLVPATPAGAGDSCVGGDWGSGRVERVCNSGREGGQIGPGRWVGFVALVHTVSYPPSLALSAVMDQLEQF